MHFNTVLLLLTTAIWFVPASAVAAGDVHGAVLAGDLPLVTALVEDRPDSLDARDVKGRTPLVLAIEKGFEEIAAALVELGADINLPDAENYSPLHYASAEGHATIARLLLDKGTTTINDTSQVSRGGLEGGWTPLHMASLTGQPEIVRLLLDYGADIEARDGVQRTPLIITAESGDVRVAEVLLDRGADINAQAIRGYTAILWGARNRFEEYVDLLISRKAAIADDALTRTMQMAVVTGLESLFEYVLDLGCDVAEIRERDPGLIFPAAGGGSVMIVRSLVEFGFDPAQVDSDGWTPLHGAAAEGHTGVVKYFADAGMDLESRNKRGESAYDLAVLKGHNETADFLRDGGADSGGPRFPIIEGPYMGQEPPGDTPVLFMPGIVSAHDRAHSSIAFSPDALEAYWTEMIPPAGRVAFSHVEEGRWTYPVAADIDRDPSFSPDGQRLYFIKTRPLRDGETPGGDSDLKEEYWYLERTDTGWSAPVSAGAEVNAIGVHWPCSVDRDYNLYFSEFDRNMYCSRYIDGVYQTPVPLAEYLGNATLVGRSPFMSPDRDYLLFSTDDGLCISFRRNDSVWTDRINLGSIINSTHANGSPRVTADRRYMFFLSAGQGRPWGIYWVSTDFIESLRLEHQPER